MKSWSLHMNLIKRIRFLSNCLGLRDFTVEAFYTKKTKISMDKHPKKVIIQLWRNKYTLTFSDPINANLNSVLRSFDYTKVISS